MVMAVDDRLTALEARVSALESSSAPANTGLPPSTEDTFWALLELARRNGRPESNGSVMIVGDVAAPNGQAAQWQLEANLDDLLAQDWGERAGVFAALGAPVRLEILRAVITGRAATAKELGEVLTANSSGQIYHHLKELTATGWLVATGNKGFAVPPGRLVPLLTTILGGQR